MGAADQGGRRQRGLTPAPLRPSLRVVAEQDQRGVVVAAPLELVETLRRAEIGLGRLLDHDQRTGREPSAGARRGQRLRRLLP